MDLTVTHKVHEIARARSQCNKVFPREAKDTSLRNNNVDIMRDMDIVTYWKRHDKGGGRVEIAQWRWILDGDGVKSKLQAEMGDIEKEAVANAELESRTRVKKWRCDGY